MLPGSRHCLSRRSFVIRLHEPGPGRLRLRGTRVTVARRRVKVFCKRGHIRARVDLRGRAPERVRVKVEARKTSRQGTARHAGLPDMRSHAQEEALGVRQRRSGPTGAV